MVSEFEARNAAAAAGIAYDPAFTDLSRSEQAALIAHIRCRNWIDALEAHHARLNR